MKLEELLSSGAKRTIALRRRQSSFPEAGQQIPRFARDDNLPVRSGQAFPAKTLNFDRQVSSVYRVAASRYIRRQTNRFTVTTTIAMTIAAAALLVSLA